MAKFLFYNHPRPAKLEAENKTLTLKYGDLYKVEKLAGRWWVVRDGLRYPIKPSAVTELKRRSKPSKPSEEFEQDDSLFDTFAQTAEKYVYARAKALSKDATAATRNGVAFARFPMRSKSGEVVCVLSVSRSQLMATIYCPGVVSVEGWDFIPTLWQAIERIGQRMKQHDKFEVGQFSTHRAKALNVGTPWGERFSGTIVYHSTKWVCDVATHFSRQT